ncbi:hypothetical protein GNI_060990 [Gregarina niphandrodes]|uniref:Uncharacterized protein n=1 Tax=Gregarina niphandrodes TaxID=110365 RepID=A0A023B8D9_GRENI|nr:hypothetical protein GNI_060990 [Gregarina niphandrodes]EZG68889.1 hypothetical protein GNI_060990 [Gregarina niphandrodes]|eukprot:XP_011134534.1 hypothetical protein GNI_060990 [Gregarina niphandrodes]
MSTGIYSFRPIAITIFRSLPNYSKADLASNRIFFLRRHDPNAGDGRTDFNPLYRFSIGGLNRSIARYCYKTFDCARELRLHALGHNALHTPASPEPDAGPDTGGLDTGGLDTGGLDTAGLDTAGLDTTDDGRLSEGKLRKIPWRLLMYFRIPYITKELLGLDLPRADWYRYLYTPLFSDFFVRHPTFCVKGQLYEPMYVVECAQRPFRLTTADFCPSITVASSIFADGSQSKLFFLAAHVLLSDYFSDTGTASKIEILDVNDAQVVNSDQTVVQKFEHQLSRIDSDGTERGAIAPPEKVDDRLANHATHDTPLTNDTDKHRASDVTPPVPGTPATVAGPFDGISFQHGLDATEIILDYGDQPLDDPQDLDPPTPDASGRAFSGGSPSDSNRLLGLPESYREPDRASLSTASEEGTHEISEEGSPAKVGGRAAPHPLILFWLDRDRVTVYEAALNTSSLQTIVAEISSFVLIREADCLNLMKLLLALQDYFDNIEISRHTRVHKVSSRRRREKVLLQPQVSSGTSCAGHFSENRVDEGHIVSNVSDGNISDTKLRNDDGWQTADRDSVTSIDWRLRSTAATLQEGRTEQIGDLKAESSQNSDSDITQQIANTSAPRSRNEESSVPRSRPAPLNDSRPVATQNRAPSDRGQLDTGQPDRGQSDRTPKGKGPKVAPRKEPVRTDKRPLPEELPIAKRRNTATIVAKPATARGGGTPASLGSTPKDLRRGPDRSPAESLGPKRQQAVPPRSVKSAAREPVPEAGSAGGVETKRDSLNRDVATESVGRESVKELAGREPGSEPASEVGAIRQARVFSRGREIPDKLEVPDEEDLPLASTRSPMKPITTINSIYGRWLRRVNEERNWYFGLLQQESDRNWPSSVPEGVFLPYRRLVIEERYTDSGLMQLFHSRSYVGAVAAGSSAPSNNGAGPDGPAPGPTAGSALTPVLRIPRTLENLCRSLMILLDGTPYASYESARPAGPVKLDRKQLENLSVFIASVPSFGDWRLRFLVKRRQQCLNDNTTVCGPCNVITPAYYTGHHRRWRCVVCGQTGKKDLVFDLLPEDDGLIALELENDSKPRYEQAVYDTLAGAFDGIDDWGIVLDWLIFCTPSITKLFDNGTKCKMCASASLRLNHRKTLVCPYCGLTAAAAKNELDRSRH